MTDAATLPAPKHAGAASPTAAARDMLYQLTAPRHAQVPPAGPRHAAAPARAPLPLGVPTMSSGGPIPSVLPHPGAHSSDTPLTRAQLAGRLGDARPPAAASRPVPGPGPAAGEPYRQGQLLAGRYRLVERLGAGGRGEIWRAVDQASPDQRAVAVKFPLLEAAGRPGAAAQMFRTEAQSGRRVHHPNVVETLDFRDGLGYGTADGGQFLVLGLVEGRNLETVVREDGPFDYRQALRLLAQAARGLHAIHRAGLVHRDVTPVNLIWDGTTVTLMDFGIALPPGAPTLTEDILVPGNPEYMAPELVLGQPAGRGADIYSLGVTFLFLITGVRPFHRDSLEDTALAHVMDPAPPVPADLPADLRALIASMVDKDPGRRPASALAVARLFETFAESDS